MPQLPHAGAKTMRTLTVGAIVGLLAVTASALGQDPPTTSNVIGDALAPQTGDSGGRMWATGEYLMWWLRGDRLPPLVTSSPSGTPQSAAGVLGGASTQVLFGNSSVNGDGRSGGRLTAGYWIDCEQTWGIEASFFMLEGLGTSFAAQSSGSPILARPFLNATTGRGDSELVAFPGIINGSVSAAVGSRNLLGAEALARRNLLQTCGTMGTFRLDVLAGYRFLYLDEALSVEENLTTTGAVMGAPAGTRFVIGDQFGTHNVFNGGEVGLAGGLRNGAWSLDVVGKVAVGATCETVNISGSTAVTLPGGQTNVLPGGLLALSSNSGQHSSAAFSWVPELDVNLGYWITQNVRLTVGYTLLYWTNVVRPGDQIDLAVNPNLLPPVLAGGAARPAFSAERSSLWVQGVSVGLEFRY
jgi:hypothetical protein